MNKILSIQKKLFILLFLIMFPFLLCISQERIDSLENVLEEAPEKQKASLLLELAKEKNNFNQRVEALDIAKEALELAEKYNNEALQAETFYVLGQIKQGERDFDTAIEYYEKSLKIAEENNLDKSVLSALNSLSFLYYYTQQVDSLLEYAERTLELALELKDSGNIAEAYGLLGIYYYMNNDYKKTLDYWEKEVTIRELLKDNESLATAYNNLGVIYKNFGNYEKAIEYYQKNLKLVEKLGKTLSMARSLSNIGNVYFNFGIDYEKALDYYNEGYELFEKEQDSASMANLLNNMGLIYRTWDDFDKALDYFERALAIARRIDDKGILAKSLSDIAVIHLEQGRYREALEENHNALELFKDIGDKKEIASIQRNVGESYLKLKQYQKALDYYRMSLNLFKDMNLKKELLDTYREISNVYAAIGKNEEALKYYKRYSELKDSTLSEKYLETIEDMQAKYESEQKEQQITLLNEKNRRQEAENKRQRVMIYSLIIIFLLIAAFAIVIFRQFRQIRRQRDQIVQQKQEITDSIQYASKIQQAILPPKESIDRMLPENFILFKPRDIVSGDYYWMTRKNSKVVFTAADCTGHGVPGAFMSMLGTTMLNEIVNKMSVVDADQILNELRKYVINSLHQTGKSGESQDGMDLALCVLDYDTHKLQYSGANNPLYLIREKELIEYKADKMPIGIYHEKTGVDFKRHDIDVKKGDVLYLFSDGYVDQFGGEKHKKFMKKNFKELLINIHKKPMHEQYSILDETIEKWKGDIEQVDDIVVIGVRV